MGERSEEREGRRDEMKDKRGGEERRAERCKRRDGTIQITRSLKRCTVTLVN